MAAWIRDRHHNVRHMNRRRTHRLWVGFAVVTLLLGASLFAWSETVEARRADLTAWCYAGTQWLRYAEGIPGNVSRDAITDCFADAAERGEGFAIRGQRFEHGALLDLGEVTLLWQGRPNQWSFLTIDVYEDHMTFLADCSAEFQIELDALGISSGTPGCLSRAELFATDLRVTDPDFVIYALDRKVIIDGEQGWYHTGYDGTGNRGDDTPRTVLFLETTGHGIWNTSVIYYKPRLGLSITSGPLTGVDGHHFGDAVDWARHVNDYFLPDYVADVESTWRPDWGTYWYQINRLFDLIHVDLFGDRASEVPVFINGVESRAMIPVEGRVIEADQSDTFADLLVDYVRAITDPDEFFGPEFVATMLSVWERYIPHFRSAEARRNANFRFVYAGNPISFEPPSERTIQIQRQLFGNLPSDPSVRTTVGPDDLIRTVFIELGRPYHWTDWVVLTSTQEFSDAFCWIQERPSPDEPYQLQGHYFWGRLSNEDELVETWNGLIAPTSITIKDDDGGIIGAEMLLRGTPTQLGRVLVEVTTRCPAGTQVDPGATLEDRRVLGYIELIVVEPEDWKP